MVSLGFAAMTLAKQQAPALLQLETRYRAPGESVRCVPGMIPGKALWLPSLFVLQKWLFFSGVQQAFFIRKATTSGRFSC